MDITWTIRSALSFVIAASVLILACGEPPTTTLPIYTSEPQGFGFTLQTRGGTYSDGSGRLGLAVLSTLRDAAGRGPESPWTVTLSGTAGTLASMVYDDALPGSQASWWWPELPVRSAEHYWVTVSGGGDKTLSSHFQVAATGELDVPQVELSSDGARIEWSPVNRAVAYACRVSSGSDRVLSIQQPTPGCDVSSLPPGNYTASILAFSLDPARLREEYAQQPSIPEQFHVSEGRIAFVRGADGVSTFRLLAAGGHIQYGTSTPGLALWLSIVQPDGTPSTESWKIEVVGPGLSTTHPLVFTYPASLPRHLVWAYDIRAMPGVYSLTASSTNTFLGARFSVGGPGTVSGATNVMVETAANGGATVQWSPAMGAKNYLVSVWDRAAARRVASRWVTTPPIQFPVQSFIADLTYDVYVTTTNVDMTGGPPPTQVSVIEDAYAPTTFVAR